jgi:LiaI-LiaF-like transmembrane region
MADKKKGNSLVWGVILIVFGLLFLLDQFNIDIWDAVWRFWPVILIIWGANKLWLGLKERNEGSIKPGPDKGHEI